MAAEAAAEASFRRVEVVAEALFRRVAVGVAEVAAEAEAEALRRRGAMAARPGAPRS